MLDVLRLRKRENRKFVFRDLQQDFFLNSCISVSSFPWIDKLRGTLCFPSTREMLEYTGKTVGFGATIQGVTLVDSCHLAG